MARTYAEDTRVPVSKTRVEIEDLLRKHGVEDTATRWLKDHGIVAFQHAGRVFRFQVALPALESFAVIETDKPSWQWKTRTPEQQRAVWEQACRTKWRSILLIIKARLVAIEAGAETWESAFLFHVVGPNGELLGPSIVEKLERAYGAGGAPLPPLLPAGAAQ